MLRRDAVRFVALAACLQLGACQALFPSTVAEGLSDASGDEGRAGDSGSSSGGGSGSSSGGSTGDGSGSSSGAVPVDAGSGSSGGGSGGSSGGGSGSSSGGSPPLCCTFSDGVCDCSYVSAPCSTGSSPDSLCESVGTSCCLTSKVGVSSVFCDCVGPQVVTDYGGTCADVIQAFNVNDAGITRANNCASF